MDLLLGLRPGIALLAFTALAAIGQDRTHSYPLAIHGGVTFVRVLLGERDCRFILDTGASATILTPATAKAAGFRISENPDLQQRRTLPSLAVAGQNVRDLGVIVYDPPQARPLRFNSGIDYHGLLGFSFLRHYRVELDYPASRFRLLPSTEARPHVRQAQSGPIRYTPITLIDGLVHIPGVVNGNREITCLIDTGAAEVVVAPQAARALGLAVVPLDARRGIALARLDSLTIAGTTVRQLEVVVHTIPQDRYRTPAYQIIVGTPFLQRFLVVLDYPGRRVALHGGEPHQTDP